MPHCSLMRSRLARGWLTSLALVVLAPEASAWSFNLQSASRRVFMYVGTASYTYNAQIRATGVTNNTTVDSIAIDMTGSMLGALTSTASLVFTPATRRNYVSQWNPIGVCTDPSIVVGAGYQNSNASPASASVTLSSPSQLTSMEGNGIPFSSIYWHTYSPDTQRRDNQWPEQGNMGSTQMLATVPRNTVSEVCFYFSYLGDTVYPAGTYDGIVTFTASTP